MSGSLSSNLSDLKRLSEILTKDLEEQVLARAKPAVKLAGQAYANDVKALAPYDTGTYRRSIHVETVVEEGGKYYAIVGTDAPQAKRLEFGFYDMTDSLGRHFYQFPRPHFRPPYDTQIGKYIAIMQGEIDKWSESADIAGRLGMIYAASDRMPSSSTSTSSRARLKAISGTMRGDFGGFE